MTKSLIIGLTGQSGAGKTTVCEILKEQGCKIINADLIAHEILDNNTLCKNKIVCEFGHEILNMSGEINRRNLAVVVFSTHEKLKKLNEILQPVIMKKIKATLKKYQDNEKKIIVLDVPLLFEYDYNLLCYKNVSIIADKIIRQNRIVCRDEISKDAADLRIKSQPSDDFYIKKSDYIIYNNITKEALKENVLFTLNAILESFYEN